MQEILFLRNMNIPRNHEYRMSNRYFTGVVPKLWISGNAHPHVQLQK
jgi:hypothetical protein